MKEVTKEQIARALALGYLTRMPAEEVFGVDDWIIYEDMDINLCGAYHSAEAPKDGLIVAVYPAGWERDLPDPLFTLTVTKGESK